MSGSGILSKVLKTFVGSKSERDFKELSPIIDEVATPYNTFSSLSNDDLRAKTTVLKGKITEKTKANEDEVTKLKEQIDVDTNLSISDKEAIYIQIDELDKEILKQIEEVLDEIKGEAFAVVKETARRFTENKTLEVSATQMDRDMAAQRDSVEIQGDKAIYHNTWLAAGTEVSWEMIHYDVQLIGGRVLHEGKIAEMMTGEGKTLVATLPVYLNANSQVQDAQANSSSTMDSSSNFIMHCEQTKASTFGKYFKYKVDSNGNYTFKYDSAEKTNFETELTTDISNQKLYHYDRTFLNSSRKTTDAAMSNLLLQYISSIFFDRPDVTDLVKDPTGIRDNIVNNNIPGLIGLEITSGLNTNTYASGNNPLVSMFQQIKRQLPNRFSNDNVNVEYNFPFKSGDTIAIFVKLKANIFYNATSSANGHTQELYDILRSNNPNFGAISHYNLLEFNDTNKTIKIKPTTWRIVLNLK